MINLFKAYFVVSGGNFVRYMRTKKDDYDDGVDIKPDKLMSDALNKYNIHVQQGAWNTMSPEQEQTVTLTLTVKKLKDDNLCLSDKIRK
eukprot:10104407-Ditylum_brightwellii.AAC.1